MRATVPGQFGRPDSLVDKVIPELEPKADHVVIEVKALGSTTPKGTCGGFASAMVTATTGVQGLRRGCR
jgi:hypothetical protein